MASVAPRSLRAVSVDCSRFPLATFHRRISEAFGLRADRYGLPGGFEPDLSDLCTAGSTYLLGELLSKFDDGKVSETKERATWDRFHEAERSCFEVNQRLAVSGLDGPYEEAMVLARKVAAKILGRFDWDQAAKQFGWGPGASTRLTRRKSDAAYKYTGHPETTVGNAILADAAIRSVPLWQQSLTLCETGVGYCTIVPGNRIVTVPKNFKTDRTIAIEPDMNMYIQKGIGGMMRDRLKLYGCDLDDQTRNQRLAQVGSLSGRLATIDLSMASDTVSRELVSKFIRSDWLSALEQTRSPFGVLPSGDKIFYQKFSSMGNGFTFELESLIFYSLALAWCHLMGEEISRVSVYGDDIIVPSAVAESFCGLLQFCGFTPNKKKSYWSGPFRESCGKHFFRGHEITPFYVRRRVRKLTDLFLLHNNLKRWADRSSWLTSAQRECMTKILHWIKSYAPAKWRRPRLFDGFGDGAFIGSFDEVQPSVHPSGWEFYTTRVLSSSREVEYVDCVGLLTKSLVRLHRRPWPSLMGYIPLNDEPSEVHPVRDGRLREITILLPQSALLAG